MFACRVSIELRNQNFLLLRLRAFDQAKLESHKAPGSQILSTRPGCPPSILDFPTTSHSAFNWLERYSCTAG